jgi:HSP20 family protein
VIEKLGELAELGQELKREGSVGTEDKKAVYGFSVRVGGLGKDPIKVEPFGNVRRNAEGRTEVADEREPLVDLFDETDCVVVVAELPGVDDGDVRLELHGDVLLIAAEAEDRRYRKEVLLPSSFEASAMKWTLRNGVLEVRLSKGSP